MKLNYRQQDNGMFILNRQDIEQIATDALSEIAPQTLNYPIPLSTDVLFDKLDLMVKHKYLGIPGHEILGATIMGDSAELVACDMKMNPIVIEETYGTVLIHSTLCCQKYATRRRYTEAHECSHWILHKPYFDRLPQNRRDHLIACRAVETYKRPRRTDADWREWQADSLAAALLMPQGVFFDYAQRILKDAGAPRGYLIEGQPASRYIFQEAIHPIADRFGVSARAAQIRMIHVGLVKSASI